MPIKKSRSKLITFILFGLSLVYRCYPVSDQNYFLTIFDGDDLYSYVTGSWDLA